MFLSGADGRPTPSSVRGELVHLGTVQRLLLDVVEVVELARALALAPNPKPALWSWATAVVMSVKYGFDPDANAWSLPGLPSDWSASARCTDSMPMISAA
jgi:hypothetical protein